MQELDYIGSDQTFLNLFDSELLFERFGHGWRRWAGEAESHLHSVVDEPLEGGERSDHDDTRAQTLPHALRAKLLED